MSQQHERISGFSGPYRFLSNFYPAKVHLRGVEYLSSEHAYQAAKSKDPAVRETVRSLPTPSAAKTYGKTILLRPDWEQRKVRIMRQIVLDKFTRNPELGQQLIETGDRELVETNHWGDQFWGVCRGIGKNQLGRILMDVRHELLLKQKA